MVRYLLTLLIALICAPAVAQIQFNVPDCVPKTVVTPYGTGSGLTQVEYPGAQVYGLWCPGTVKPYVHVNLVGGTVDLKDVSSAADPLAYLQSVAMAASLQPRTPEEEQRWNRTHAFGMAYMATQRQKYAIAPNPQSTAVPPTRPSREVVSGALNLMKSAVMLPVGTECDVTLGVTFPSGADIWAAVPGQPANLRWLCRKK